MVSSYGRSITWPADGTNPHEVAVERADAYTRFTVMSIVRCLLAYADGEYVRSTAASNARARALYEAALDLVRSADAAPQTGPDVPFPANPVHGSLQTYAATSLDKIHHGLNIAATLPDSHRRAQRAAQPIPVRGAGGAGQEPRRRPPPSSRRRS